MFSAKRHLPFLEIPDKWLLGYFDIHDGSVKIKFTSIFNTSEKTPSMYLYKKGDRIFYKCFSTGNSGTLRQLMCKLTNNTMKSLGDIVTQDYLYNKYSINIKLENKSESNIVYEIDSVKYRNWSKLDSRYWNQYNINTKILEEHGVYPLLSITVNGVENGLTIKSYSFKRDMMYGYHDQRGLHKIYMPGNKLKFFTLRAILQGADQCVGKSNLLITSSLKDIMSLKSIGLTNIDIIAPPSETSYLSETELKIIRENYENVAVLFNNDTTGIKMMYNYKEMYGFNPSRLTLAKDPSDSVKHFGKDETLVNLVPSIHNALYVDL